MLKFNLLEVINKLIGLAITAILSRILANEFGTYLYYQTIFSYLYAFALFSSDYNFLVNLRIDKNYLHTSAYYQTILVKTSLVILVILFSVIFLLPAFTQFSFWPYLITVCTSLFVYDFVLYVENDQKSLIFYRMLSQIATLAGVFLFYFHLLDVYYITLIQILQTSILTFGTFFAAKKNIPVLFNFSELIHSIKSLRFSIFFENVSYFLLRNFIIFFTTIEILILAEKNMIEERNIFAEGLRLAGILAPFVLFYINFNINRIQKAYYTLITLCGILLLLLSPVYVLLFFGENFIHNTYFYNFFILVFIFNSFIEKDYLELLTKNNKQKPNLLILNSLYFSVSVVLFVIFINSSLTLTTLITFFFLKLLFYYIFFLKKFNVKTQYLSGLLSFVSIPIINIILSHFGYLDFVLRNLIYLKNQLL